MPGGTALGAHQLGSFSAKLGARALASWEEEGLLPGVRTGRAESSPAHAWAEREHSP